MRKSNKNIWQPFLEDSYDYFLHLKESTGVPMYKSKRKTGFVGFMAGIKSTSKIFEECVESENPPLNYLLTYKLSQDHLEHFFGAIRAGGGFNNNPTVQQFIAAYKRLLLHSSIGEIYLYYFYKYLFSLYICPLKGHVPSSCRVLLGTFGTF